MEQSRNSGEGGGYRVGWSENRKKFTRVKNPGGYFLDWARSPNLGVGQFFKKMKSDLAQRRKRVF